MKFGPFDINVVVDPKMPRGTIELREGLTLEAVRIEGDCLVATWTERVVCRIENAVSEEAPEK